MIRRRLVFLLALVASTGTTGCGYNQIQTLDERAASSQGQIEVQLQRRAELIPNLVNTVKGQAQFEERVLTQVAAARSGVLGAVRSGDPEQMANANAQLTRAIAPILAVVERYPTLGTNDAFADLRSQLEGTQNRIATAQQDYNQAVNDYNAYIRKFPAALTAKVTGAQPRKYFRATAEAQEVPTVDFGTGAAGTGTNTGAAPATPGATTPPAGKAP